MIKITVLICRLAMFPTCDEVNARVGITADHADDGTPCHALAVDLLETAGPAAQPHDDEGIVAKCIKTDK